MAVSLQGCLTYRPKLTATEPIRPIGHLAAAGKAKQSSIKWNKQIHDSINGYLTLAVWLNSQNGHTPPAVKWSKQIHYSINNCLTYRPPHLPDVSLQGCLT